MPSDCQQHEAVCNQKTPNSLHPTRKNPWQDTGYKGSLLKVREEKYKGKHGGAQVEAENQEQKHKFLSKFIYISDTVPDLQ
jgi:hypothetical protein